MDQPNRLPSFLRCQEYPLLWQMSEAEKIALVQLLETARPEVAVEIGTYRGGSLQVLSAHATKVYSIDTDPQVSTSLGPLFSNVEFLCGDSAELLPHTLSAAHVEREDTWLTVATPGGDRQVQWLAQAIQRFRRGAAAAEIASAPRWFVCPEGDRFGVPAGVSYTVRDLLDDTSYVWHGEWNYVRFEPGVRQAHILKMDAHP